jgi:hypothetical protein
MTTQAQIDAAREVLIASEPKPNVLAALGAAAMAATAAVLLAGVMILGPGVAIDDTPPAAAPPL